MTISLHNLTYAAPSPSMRGRREVLVVGIVGTDPQGIRNTPEALFQRLDVFKLEQRFFSGGYADCGTETNPL